MQPRQVTTPGGLRLDVRDTGPGPRESVLLLHGFPQDASAWDRVIPPLRTAGYRVLAPDQRGYSPGARPAGRSAYTLPDIAGDALALLDDTGVDRAHVVGHDWGGSVGWYLGARHADRLASLTVLSTPHPAAMQAALLGVQGLRSSYVAVVQVPVLPELTLGAFGAWPLRRVLQASGLPAPVAARYAARMSDPLALSCALGWYRALPFWSGGTGRTRVPTLYVWGAKDPALGRRSAEATGRYVRAPYRFEVLPAAGHWLPETAADAVVPLVLEHLAAHPVTP